LDEKSPIPSVNGSAFSSCLNLANFNITPGILTERCGLADVINGYAGIAVPHDAVHLSRALSEMLANDSLKTEFGKRGRKLVEEKYNWQKIAAQVEGLYTAVMAWQPG